jgi:hypothetical protein
MSTSIELSGAVSEALFVKRTPCALSAESLTRDVQVCASPLWLWFGIIRRSFIHGA